MSAYDWIYRVTSVEPDGTSAYQFYPAADFVRNAVDSDVVIERRFSEGGAWQRVTGEQLEQLADRTTKK